MMRYLWMLKLNAVDGEGNDLGGGQTSFAAAEPASAEPAEEPTGSDVNWSDVADELVTDESGEVEGEVEVVGEPAAPTPPAEPAPVSPEPVPASEPTPPSAPEVAPLEPPSAPTATPEEYSSWRTQRLSQLEQVYALDEEAAQAMLTEPELVLPKLAAKVHMEVLENSMRAMQAMVPVMLQQVNHHTEVESRAKSLFAGVNPDLVSPQYTPMIMELGTAYRRVNPSAPPEVAAKAIGNLVRAALGIAAQPSAPAASQGGNPLGSALPVPTPFSPARGAGGGSVRATPSNPFEALAMEMETDDWM